MRTKIQYTSEEDRARIIIENSSRILVEVQNIIDGNFLIFVDSLSDIIPEPTPVEKQQIELKTNVDLLQEENNDLKFRVTQAERLVADASLTQQQLIELLIDMGVL